MSEMDEGWSWRDKQPALPIRELADEGRDQEANRKGLAMAGLAATAVPGNQLMQALTGPECGMEGEQPGEMLLFGALVSLRGLVTNEHPDIRGEQHPCREHRDEEDVAKTWLSRRDDDRPGEHTQRQSRHQ